MKCIKYALAGFGFWFVAGLCGMAQDRPADMPPELADARREYNIRLEAATRPSHSWYVSQLKYLVDSYVRHGKAREGELAGLELKRMEGPQGASPIQTSDPQELRILKTNYQHRISQVKNPLDTWYRDRMEQLKMAYIRVGRLEHARYAERMIEDFKQGKAETGVAGGDFLNQSKWKLLYGGSLSVKDGVVTLIGRGEGRSNAAVAICDVNLGGSFKIEAEMMVKGPSGLVIADAKDHRNFVTFYSSVTDPDALRVNTCAGGNWGEATRLAQGWPKDKWVPVTVTVQKRKVNLDVSGVKIQYDLPGRAEEFALGLLKYRDDGQSNIRNIRITRL